MKVSEINSQNFGWNVRTHIAITKKALENNNTLSETEKQMVGRFSQMPDKDPRELVGMVRLHFYDVSHEKSNFGRKKGKKDAMSRYLYWTNKAEKENNRERFLRKIGYALHYLQDAGTPPHTEHGNSLHKLFRFPMHKWFEKGRKVGASSRLDVLTKNYKEEELPFSNVKSLLHNTALYSVQPENKVEYHNIKKWPEIQQRCFDRSINASKAFLNYILQFLPKS